MRIPLTLSLLLLAAPAAGQLPTRCAMPAHPDREQSPVNITRAYSASFRPVATHYTPRPGRLFFDGHRVQVNVSSGERLVVDGASFELEEFHFHWPGEHELHGHRPVAEIHMVHKRGGDTVAVIGTWVEQGEHKNLAWAAIFDHLSGRDTATVQVDLASLFQLHDLNRERVYRYCGSLTTHPYTTGITWLMRDHVIYLSHDQIRKLKEVMREPYSRGVQPLHGRMIRYRPY